MEIEQRHPEEPAAVALLEAAIGALTSALDDMPITEIATLKAKVATVQTATRELGMSKEAQDLATEAVRRAEWAVRRATKRAQAEGELASRESNLRNNPRNDGSSISTLPTPRDYFNSEAEYRDALVMGELDGDQFDAAIDAAKADGNLSRANVARKARESVDAPQARSRRRPLPDAFFDAAYDLTKVCDRLARLAQDDRFRPNAVKVAAKHRDDLHRARAVLTDVIERMS